MFLTHSLPLPDFSTFSRANASFFELKKFNIDNSPRPISQSKTFGGFGIMKMESGNKIRRDSGVSFPRVLGK